MALSPGSSVAAREVAELRLLNSLTENYTTWVDTVVREAASATNPDLLAALLEARYRELVIQPTMQSAVIDGFQSKAADYLSRYNPVADIADVAQAVRDYATSKDLTKRASRTLLRDSLSVDARVLERIPDELLKMTGKGAPRLVHPRFPFVESGMTYRDRLATSARTLSTGMAGWSARRAAALSGEELRWVTMNDDKVRPAHRHAQGQTVAYDEPFSVGGYPLWFPGDPDAPEDLTVNCRCVLAAIAPPNRMVQRFIPSEWLTAAANPTQARAPKGARGGIGGQWIDTPGGLANRLAGGVGLDSPELDAIAANRHKPGRLTGTGTVDDPIYCGEDLDKAMDLLGEGKYVRIDGDDDDVKVLVDKLATEARGTTIDICKVSIDANLFCSGTAGRPRVTMPQFASKNPIPGSIADKQPRSAGGSVDMSEQFKADLRSRGVEFTTDTRPAANYLPAQSEMLASKSAGIAKALADGADMPGTVFVSNDGYVIDGHHRWAAVNLNTAEGIGDGMMNVEIVDMGITDALHYANQWTEDVGLPHADLLGNPVAPDAAKTADDRLAARLAASLTAAGGPGQARAPKGAAGGIGGQWIDTPNAMLRGLNRLTIGQDVMNGPRGPLGADEITRLRREAAEGILAREGRPGLQETANRVADIYRRTTPEQRAAGAGWYEEARGVAQGMVEDSGGKMSEEQAAAVIAHLSTRTQWDVNVIAAQTLARGGSLADANAAIHAAAQRGEVRGGGILTANWDKAQIASTSADPIGRDNASLGTFSEASNKTRTFASNIMGDPDGVCIDTWMYRVVGQEPLVTGKIEGVSQAIRKDQVYEAISESVRVAASDLGVPPVDVQASTWLWTLDNYHPSRAGRPGYITDPTTGEEIPEMIGGALVTAAMTPDDNPSIDDGEVLDYWYAQAAKVGVVPPVDTAPTLDGHRMEWIEALLASGFAPSQARIPKGQKGGGRWTVTASGVRDFLTMAKDFRTIGKPFDPNADYIVSEEVSADDVDIGLQAETMYATNRLGEDVVHDQVNGYLRGGGEGDVSTRPGGAISAVDRLTGEERFQEESYFDTDDQVAALLTGAPLDDAMIPSMVGAIDAGMEYNYTTEPTVLYRGIAADYAAGGEWAEGTRFIERGYSSTSATEEMAANFALFRSGLPSAFDDAVKNGTEVIRDEDRDGVPTMMQISVAPGTNFAYGAPMVHEVLLERKMVYEVTEVVQESVPVGLGEFMDMQVVKVAAYPMSAMEWRPDVDAGYIQQTLFDTPEEVAA